MKTPRFWYDTLQTSFLSEILTPLSYFYSAGASLRRRYAKPYHARVPVVCVGNIVAGGAGKTPTALALARLLIDDGHKPVFVSRGYKGNGKLLCVDPKKHQAADVGDEALLLAALAPTWVGADRIGAMRQAEAHGSIVIMDDGLQNPTIAPTTSILVVDGEIGLGNGKIIPAGPLRESLASALKRISALIIVGDRDGQNLASQVTVPTFHAHLVPALPPGFPKEGRFVVFSGIGRPQKFHATIKSLGLDIAAVSDFPDHHVYNETDINSLRLMAEEQGAHLLTTAKDAARLPLDFRAEVVVLPVTLTFNDENAKAEMLRLCLLPILSSSPRTLRKTIFS